MIDRGMLVRGVVDAAQQLTDFASDGGPPETLPVDRELARLCVALALNVRALRQYDAEEARKAAARWPKLRARS